MNRFEFLLSALLPLAMPNKPANSATTAPTDKPKARIDRHALVTRHNITLTKFNGESPIQVGNGEFAFGMDITGLQTFVPFNTMSQWGWHSSALPPGTHIEDYQKQVVETHGRPIAYPLQDPNHPEISAWLAGNPHRINLGRTGLRLLKRDGTIATQGDIKNTKQTLDLWTGTVTSYFELENEPVTVTTACHPDLDAVAFHIDSPLIKAGRLSVFLATPGNDPLQFANFVGDWSQPGRYEILPSPPKGRADLKRQIDDTIYYVSLAWQGDAELHEPAQKASTLTILKAEYGANDKWLDVTDLAQKRVQDGRLTLRSDNTLGPEPIHGVVKTLRVTYKVGDQTKTAEAVENTSLRIDTDEERNRLFLQPATTASTLSFICAYSPKPLPKTLPTFDAALGASRRYWESYWQKGGAIDLSESRDPRWKELERRIVLSQYLMAVNEAGSSPPQESGLVNNGWFGRFHMEMVWWHATHWALWNHWTELDRGMGIYKRILAQSQQLAKDEGYLGARWPKCIGPDGREWPFIIHSFLIWQQPHPIFFAELEYRAHPTKATLEKWQPVVEATADFMATYAFFDEKTKRYVLGPPVYVVSENTDPYKTMNPAFELGYWRFGLRTAQEWRKRMGLPPRLEWDKVRNNLSAIPVQDGVYVLHEDVQDMWTKFNFEHPALIGTFGLLPGDGVDQPTMHRTLDKIKSVWNFEHTWGWDFPMLAMCAARLSEPESAIDFLLTSASGFQFDERGLATGGPFPYFPSNGGLLYAVAMMAAGWDGAPKKHAPGFPDNGQWTVRWENLNPAL